MNTLRHPGIAIEARPQSSWLDILTKIIILGIFLVGLNLLFVYKVTILSVTTQIWFVNAYIVLTGLFLTSRFFIVLFYSDSHAATYPARAYPRVSFVIAAKNEEKSIFKTIVACMESEYPAAIECIAIDDGSNDGTRKEMHRAEGWYQSPNRRVRVIDFDVNRGKREAMAEGILAATGAIVVFVDSDSFVGTHSLKHIIEHFLEDQRVGAVAGNSGVANEHDNALTKMQSARYGVSFDIFKACESVFGVVTCCPGCFSAYRRDVLLTVLKSWRYQTFMGTRSTFGDDRSLTNFVLRKWRVVYCRRATAVTIVPNQYSTFFRQQLRWKKSWVREGLAAASFIWKKNIIASLSFYTNLLIPIFSPVIVFNAFVIQPYLAGRMPLVFAGGVVFLSFLYGLFYYWQSNNRYWWYLIPFTAMYTSLLVWQMPYAVLRLRDTKWGTR